MNAFATATSIFILASMQCGCHLGFFCSLCNYDSISRLCH